MVNLRMTVGMALGLTLGECVGLQHRQNLAAFPAKHQRGGTGALKSGLVPLIGAILSLLSPLSLAHSLESVWLLIVLWKHFIDDIMDWHSKAVQSIPQISFLTKFGLQFGDFQVSREIGGLPGCYTQPERGKHHPLQSPPEGN